MGTIYVVATPIGNLGDITARALLILKNSAVIFAEDTRVTQKLVTHFELHTKISHYDEHKPQRTIEEAIKYLEDGCDISIVSDAGTPGISDPGSVLITCIKKTLHSVAIIAIPGPSAVISALSVSGISANKFTFLGYPPLKNKRKKFFSNIKEIETRPVVLYESPHRLQKTLKEIGEVYGLDYKIFISKELTKIHETNISLSINDAINYFVEERGKGEFVIIIP